MPYYLHDYIGPGRHARIVSTKATDLLRDGNTYRPQPPLTGDESVVAEVTGVEWPRLLDPVDDLPPATVITHLVRRGDRLLVAGVSHDNGQIAAVTVNGRPAEIAAESGGVADWKIELPWPGQGQIVALASDAAGNVELTGHRLDTAAASAEATTTPAHDR